MDLLPRVDVLNLLNTKLRLVGVLDLLTTVHHHCPLPNPLLHVRLCLSVANPGPYGLGILRSHLRYHSLPGFLSNGVGVGDVRVPGHLLHSFSVYP